MDQEPSEALLDIPRILDLSLEVDRRLLRHAAEQNPGFRSLMDRCLDQYLQWFPEQHWHRVYSGGLVSIPGGVKQSQGITLAKLLRIVQSLQKVERFAGFQRLLRGFRDPLKSFSTLFEVEVAAWCATRTLTVDLEFSPAVHVKGKKKHPDFLWKTKLGELYCECKSGREFESKYAEKFKRLFAVLESAYKHDEFLDPYFRLDLRVRSSTQNGVEYRLRNAVTEAAKALRERKPEGFVFKEREVSAVIRCREEMPQEETDTLRGGLITVGTTPTPISVQAAHLSLTMPIQAPRLRAFKNLLKEARTQLPADKLGAIFIELGGADTIRRDLEARLRHPSYQNTPWVSIWLGGELHSVVWRNDQPFDDRLLQPTGCF